MGAARAGPWAKLTEPMVDLGTRLVVDGDQTLQFIAPAELGS
ncbi:MAG: hypothetical protein U1F36_01255 [Planctomycetota bacterium]